jgi:hypothetical protein
MLIEGFPVEVPTWNLSNKRQKRRNVANFLGPVMPVYANITQQVVTSVLNDELQLMWKEGGKGKDVAVLNYLSTMS